MPLVQTREAHDVDHVLARVDHLKTIHEPQLASRRRVRNIMNGGQAAVAELLGADAAIEYRDVPLPVLMMRGLTILAQKIGRAPTLKVPAISREPDSDASRHNAEKRERVIEGLDDESRLPLQLAQLGRWILGYGFGVWLLRDHLSPEGYLYPIAELRDPFDCYPGYWGPTQRPQELGIIRQVPPEVLAAKYPRYKDRIDPPRRERATRSQVTHHGGVVLGTGTRGGWERNSSQDDGLEVAEYMDITGTYTVIPERDLLVDFVPNPLGRNVPFVIPRRLSFDQLTGHYDHLIGLTVAMVKMTIYGIVAMEEAIEVETNVMGEVLSGEYHKGRGETNILAPGTKVDRPQNNLPYQLFQQIDRVERYLRGGAGYAIQDDGDSPIDYTTGRGIENLGVAMSNEVREYQLTLEYALMDLDYVRLEWDEVCYGGMSKPVLGHIDGKSWTETYDPAIDIGGRYRTRRVYGVMAGWDEPSKIITGIQMMGAELLDPLSVQEQIDGIDDVGVVNRRIRQHKAEQALYAIIEQSAAQPSDPQLGPNPEAEKAKLALYEIFKNPDDLADILAKYYTPEEPQMSPEEQAFLSQGQPSPLDQAFGGGGAPPNVQTILSRLELGGSAEGGSQTVARV